MPLPSKALTSDAKISIASASDLHSHFDDLYDDLHTPETEHTWQKIERALLHIQAITRGGATKYVEFVALLKDASAPINNALLSERTKLSGSAGDLLNSIAPRMAERFEPLVPVFVPTLLLICARTNKVAVKRAEKSLHFIIKHCAPPSVVSYLREAIKDKGQGLRAVAAGTLVLVLEHTETDRLTRRVADIETCIKSGATDSNPEVRQTTKKLFELYVSAWPERVEQFTKPMTPTIRRYLSLPKTGALQVNIPPMTEAAARATRPPAPHSNHQEDTIMPISQASHASRSRTAPAYNFFPDLQKTTASSSASTSAARMQSGPGFGMNDATYAKRGLFADQIAQARNARLARVPSFNFDEVAKSDSVLAPTMKRQPSFDHLRAQGPVVPAAMFRVQRFDVTAAPGRQESSNGTRPRSGPGSDPATRVHGDINASAPIFAAASGLHGKSALLAAYKQAFVGDVPSAKASSSSSRDRRHRDKSDRSDKRREKTVTVRFEPSPDSNEVGSDRLIVAIEGGANEMPRSKSAPQFAAALEHSPKDVNANTQIPTNVGSNAAAVRSSHGQASGQNADWIDSDDDEDEDRPSTPPERFLHTQTPRTGVKASRVPAQRVAASAVKVSAMRVAAPTPSAKIGPSRIATVSASVESSPAPKVRAVPRTPKALSAKIDVVPAVVPATDTATEEQKRLEVQDQKDVETEKQTALPTGEEGVKDMPAAVKKTASSTVQAVKQPAKVMPVNAAPSASLAAKARLEARPAKQTPTGATTEGRQLSSKTASTAAKPIIAKRPVINSTASAFKPVARPSATAASTSRVSKPTTAGKRSTTSSSASTQAKPVTTTKPAAVAVPATASTVKKADPTLTSRSSTLTASTASTRNKIVPSATVKKFQPKPASSLRTKSSIAASLTAKSKLVGVKAAASDRVNAVKKASVALVKAVERQKRASAVGGVGPQESVAAAIIEPVVADVVVEAVEEASDAQEFITTVEEAAEAFPDSIAGSQAIGGSLDEKRIAINETELTVEPQSASDQVIELPVDEALISTIDDAICTHESTPGSEKPKETSTAEDSQDAVRAVQAEAVTPAAYIPVTPSRAPNVTTSPTPSKVRTPLSSKDTNLPRTTLSSNTTPSKPFSPIRSITRSTPVHSSPLRRNPHLVPVQFGPDSFESESGSEDDEQSEEVVQLHFSGQRVQDAGKRKGVEERAKKQLVLELGSDDGLIEGGEGDETVLMESVA